MRAYYDPQADIAWLPTGNSERVVSEEVGWGLIDRDEETDGVVAFEIWAAGKRLPRALVDALPGPRESRDQPRSTTLHYDPEVDIASIRVEEGPAVSNEYPWGLIDRDPDTDRLMGFVIWKASTVLPAEMIDALRPSSKSRGVAA
jgi:uncharacterized protein YuzE